MLIFVNQYLPCLSYQTPSHSLTLYLLIPFFLSFYLSQPGASLTELRRQCRLARVRIPGVATPELRKIKQLINKAAAWICACEAAFARVGDVVIDDDGKIVDGGGDDAASVAERAKRRMTLTG
jgi:hypothetical protein